MVGEGVALIQLLVICVLYVLSKTTAVRVGTTKKLLEWQYGTELEYSHEIMQGERTSYVFFDGVREFTIDEDGHVSKIKER